MTTFVGLNTFMFNEVFDMKICTTCGEVKEDSEYATNRAYPKGCPRCRDCVRISRRTRYWECPEAARAKRKTYYAASRGSQYTSKEAFDSGIIGWQVQKTVDANIGKQFGRLKIISSADRKSVV